MSDNEQVKMTETVELAVPFTYNGETVSEVTLRRPNMKLLRKVAKVNGTDVDKAHAMIQYCSGLAPAAVDELSDLDIDKISKAIDSFS